MTSDGHDLAVDILSLSGECIARVPVTKFRSSASSVPADATGSSSPPTAVTVRDVREYLRDSKGIPLTRLQLVSANDVLEDRCKLAELPQPLSLTLVTLTETAWSTDGRWEGLLLLAARKADATAVKGILQRQINPNCVDTTGRTPLFIAAGDGHADIVQVLHEAEADPNKAKQSGMGPLYVAAQNGHLEVVRMLCNCGVDQDIALGPYSVTPLFAAAQNGHADVVELLCTARADKDKARQSGMTPLCVASQNGHVEVVRILCTAGADKIKAKLDGEAPLHAAVRRGLVEVVRSLCQARANLEQVDGSGMTSLDIATWGEHEECRAVIEGLWHS